MVLCFVFLLITRTFERLKSFITLLEVLQTTNKKIQSLFFQYTRSKNE